MSNLEQAIQDLVMSAIEKGIQARTEAQGLPMLLSIKEAQARTGIARDRLIQAFHAGEIQGMWSAGRGRGQILLKPESVYAWIDAQIAEQSSAREAALASGKRRRP